MTSVSGSGERILAILDLFDETRPEWSTEAMMSTLGYSRPTLYRYLKTLKDAGFIVSLPQAGWTLGPRVTELDFLMRRADPLIRVGGPYLKDLAARFPSSAFLVRWYGRRLLCVASEVSASRPRSSYPRGRPMPLGRGAITRAIVAYLPRREQEALVADLLPEFTASGSGENAAEVLDTLRAVRREGIALARGEVTPGVIGVAAPILAEGGAPLGALCVTSADDDADPARIARIRTAVAEAARSISAELRDPARLSA